MNTINVLFSVVTHKRNGNAATLIFHCFTNVKLPMEAKSTASALPTPGKQPTLARHLSYTDQRVGRRKKKCVCVKSALSSDRSDDTEALVRVSSTKGESPWVDCWRKSHMTDVAGDKVSNYIYGEVQLSTHLHPS